VETFRDNTVVEELRRELNGSFRQGDMVSRSHLMKNIFAMLPQIAESDATVLVEGETGTGKEILARALHDQSTRRDKPFVAINCAALPDSLLESELFGYKAGAFTNAVRDKPGYFSMAQGGTILLDELGETSPAFQVKLLRVLEERTFQMLGDVHQQQANVRILAATNLDLESLVEQGRFGRICFTGSILSAFACRPCGIAKETFRLLIERFISKMNRLRGKAVSGIGSEALERLMRHDYPGNIRELENIIEHAFILCTQGEINLQHLPTHLAPCPNRSRSLRPCAPHIKPPKQRCIREALRRNGYNRLATARELGMHKSTLFRKLKKLNLSLPPVDGRSPASGNTG
jgi:transcriptional regulator with PAS, ATPase and Fis domain